MKKKKAKQGMVEKTRMIFLVAKQEMWFVFVRKAITANISQANIVIQPTPPDCICNKLKHLLSNTEKNCINILTSVVNTYLCLISSRGLFSMGGGTCGVKL